MKHERIFIVALAYVIGFTTAYIAFGLTNTTGQETIVLTTPNNNQEYVDNSFEAFVPMNGLTVRYDEEGLFAELDGNESIISAALESEENAGQGFHMDIPFYFISPSGKYVYYCEQERLDDLECNQYVYDVERGTVYQVAVDGEAYRISVFDFPLSWTPENTLLSSQHRSISAVEPWKLEQYEEITEVFEEPIDLDVSTQ